MTNGIASKWSKPILAVTVAIACVGCEAQQVATEPSASAAPSMAATTSPSWGAAVSEPIARATPESAGSVTAWHSMAAVSSPWARGATMAPAAQPAPAQAPMWTPDLTATSSPAWRSSAVPFTTTSVAKAADDGHTPY